MQRNLNIHQHAFAELNQYVSDTCKGVGASASSVLVIHNGTIVNEWYSGFHEHGKDSRKVDAESQFNVASVRKTYLALAISLALCEKRISSIDDLAVRYLNNADIDERSAGSTTIRHLLTHTHGLNSAGETIFAAGTDWEYNNAGVNLLLRIVRNVFHKPLARVVEERLLVPYGLDRTGWRKEKSPELVWPGESYGGDTGEEANLFVSTRELAYWGYINLMQGSVDGCQLLPKAVFEQATAIATPSMLDESLPRNGFFWWVQDRPRPDSEIGEQLPLGSYQALGLYGNAVLIIPEHQVVAVRMLNQTGGNPPGYNYIKDIQRFGNLVLECVLDMNRQML
ncbi:serine hydrolase [Paenibacillus sp. NEAU-GSW1]|uniref:serine hydrolase domain-containing protein n=1 Tax=Paenibacillus sp. NEAU-GSW1 TaxID=2682486 RepID=UPI0015665769|nr:serine hydrolase domain-containing protein [Paenibacillus sp. NEAU-GSW1]